MNVIDESIHKDAKDVNTIYIISLFTILYYLLSCDDVLSEAENLLLFLKNLIMSVTAIVH